MPQFSLLKLPSQDELLKHLRYDPESGHLWWIKKARGRSISNPAGSRRYRKGGIQPGTMAVMVNGVAYLSHRVIWRIITGDDPGKMQVDHINRNPFDNRWDNLRLADFSLQGRNRKCVNSFGHKGIWFDPSRRKWRAAVWCDGKTKYLGHFGTKAEAIAAAAPHYIA